ncbi:MAG: hypothetical protein GXZ15_01195 [Campylobacter sp.]|nr:hypothetical protein [Campylobacter sp.]
MKVEALTLEEAIIKATKELDCSTVDLNIKVIQHPSKGILGLFKKIAIIEASSFKNSKNRASQKRNVRENSKIHSEGNSKDSRSKHNKPSSPKDSTSKDKNQVDISLAVKEIQKGLKDLFAAGYFDIDFIEVSTYDATTILIKLDGKDAALLIGKEGHRYKALSYMLYSWVNHKYGYYIKLEIAQFLQNQEEMIGVYLVDIIEKVQNSGKAQTKPLDGVLVKIALKQLRDKFPDKYVGVRNSKNGKFIVVNERRK